LNDRFGVALVKGVTEGSEFVANSLMISGNIQEVGFFKDLLDGVLQEVERRMESDKPNDLLAAAGRMSETE